MIKNKNLIIADLGLALVAVLWGGGFVAVKDAVNDVAPFYLIAARFVVSGLVLSLFYFKRLKVQRSRI